MSLTYIFGHKNPDTDSVCSSIALAYLKNELGEKCVPKVLGSLSKETKFVLNYFKVDVPSYLNDVKVRIKNLKFARKALIHEHASINDAYKLMQKENTTAIPLVDDNKLLTGYVTLKEITQYLITNNSLELDTTFNNIASVIDAQVIREYDSLFKGFIQGGSDLNPKLFSDNTLVVTSDTKIMDLALTKKVKILILPVGYRIDTKLLKKAEKNQVSVLISNYNLFQTMSRLLLSNYIKSLNTNSNPITVNSDDYYSDFKQMIHKINHTNYPVVNKRGECLGLLRLTGPHNYDKQKVILVDHNNLEQSVEGIEEAEILEIIDHHNLGAIGTTFPINFQSRPVGCTATIIYDLFNDEEVSIPQDIAGLLLSAILSDTSLLTSPTTTDEDKMAAIKLAKIANVDIDKYGLEMLIESSSIKDMDIMDIIKSDFKTYNIASKTIGLGQIQTVDIDYLEEHKNEFITQINLMCESEFDTVALFFTDVIKQGSYVLFNEGSSNLIRDSFGLRNVEECLFLPKVISRKKQILPSIMSTLEGDTI